MHREARQKRGNCVIRCATVDMRYASISNLVSTFKYVEPGTAECDWYHVLSIIRKDSECYFGILKHQFRVYVTQIYRRDATISQNPLST